MARMEPVHRYALLQAVMAKGILPESEAKSYLKLMTGACSDGSLSDVISQINLDLSQFHFQIRTIKYPGDDLKYIGFINKQPDGPAKLGTHYNHQQREMFKSAVEEMAVRSTANELGRLSEMELLNMEIPAQEDRETLHASSKHLTKLEKQETLKILAAEGWLADCGSRQYCVGARTFLELSELLLALDIPDETQAAWREIL